METEEGRVYVPIKQVPVSYKAEDDIGPHLSSVFASTMEMQVQTIVKKVGARSI